MIYKSILLTGIIVFILGSCSSKRVSVNKQTIDMFHKDVANNKINNSKAVHRATLRPYTVFGKKYYPFVPKVGDKYRGIASWYGPNFHAKNTSNGERYNMYAYTAAHKTLPMNTMVRVDNLENSRVVVVRINDRGPFVDGRIIDLSNKAAHSIGMVKKGTANVKLTILGFNGLIGSQKSIKPNIPTKKPILAIEKPKIEYPKIIKKDMNNSINQNKYSIQLGAFSRQEGAQITKNKYESRFINKFVTIKKVLSNNGYLFKVFIEGFTNRIDAENFKFTYNLNSAIIVNN